MDNRALPVARHIPRRAGNSKPNQSSEVIPSVLECCSLSDALSSHLRCHRLTNRARIPRRQRCDLGNSPQSPLTKYYPPCNLMNGASPRPNPTVRAFSFVAQALSLCAVAVASDLTGCRTPRLLGAVLDPVFDPVSSFSLPFPGAPRFVRPVRTKRGTTHTTKR